MAVADGTAPERGMQVTERVLRVCRAVLRDDHEAQDAFQAVFLVLIHKAGSLWAGGPDPRRGCLAAGLASRDGQKPAGARTRAAPRPAD